jgi:alpha-galactosidase
VKNPSLEDYKAPYKLMSENLKKLNRDVVLNLCQYGMGDVWKWGAEFGHCWRTTGDLGLENAGSMPGFYYIGISNAQHWENAGPGGWNDPDYILIGWVGSAFVMGEGEKTKLTADEQYFYMSMWSLMAAPLIFSGDMDKLDDFTLNVLCNSEVIDISQDVLGKQARILRNSNDELVMLKDLEDGSKAVGLFHVTGKINEPADYFDWVDIRNPVKIKFTASETGLPGKFRIRDVWRQEDVGEYSGSYVTEVPFHGVKLLKITPLVQ